MAVVVEVKESPEEKEVVDDKAHHLEDQGGLARRNWKKIFAVRQFLSLAQVQSKAAPAELLVANRYLVGKKIANGAFGQLRMGKDIESGQQVAIKLEPVNARIPMLFLEHRFYKVTPAAAPSNDALAEFMLIRRPLIMAEWECQKYTISEPAEENTTL